MKNFVILLLFALVTSISVSFAQCDTARYVSKVFESITTYQDVQYGSATKWNIPYDQKNLYMNIYVPNGDTLTKRPLMIWIHGGGFLLGNKDIDDMVDLCDSFAKRGYVTATISYRLGFNPTSPTSAERAVYRGTQDARAAIRFLKEKYLDYGIDTNYTFIGGTSAGGFSAVHTVYLDQDEAPSSIEAGVGYPALGCLDCEGNNYKHNMDITGYVNMWGAIGDSTWIDPDETAKGLLIHGLADGTVPFGVGHPFGVPTTPITHGSRSIHNQLDALGIPHSTYFVPGQSHEFQGGSNGDWSAASPPTPYWDTIFNLIDNHYAGLLQKPTFEIIAPTIICSNDTLTFKVNLPENYSVCWEADGGNVVAQYNDSIRVVFNNPGQYSVTAKQFSEIARYNGEESITINVLESPTINFVYEIDLPSVNFSAVPQNGTFVNFNWDFGDNTYSSAMSPSHIYTAPGIYSVILKGKAQNGCIRTNQNTIDLSTLAIQVENEEGFKIFPNPTQNQLNISFTKETDGFIEIYNSIGRRVISQPIHSKKVNINVEMLSPGVYWIAVPNSAQKQKLIIQ